MTQGDPRKYGYVSPYLQTPPRSLEEVERDRQTDEPSTGRESNSQNRSSTDKAGKR